MRVYLETSVVIVWLFGAEREPERHAATQALFRLINDGRIDGVVSLYTVQEVYTFCEENFPQEEARTAAKLALRRLLATEVELAPLLDRATRIVESRRFAGLSDPSDQPHAIAAFVEHCERMITYDHHFQAIRPVLPVFTPEELLQELQERAV